MSKRVRTASRESSWPQVSKAVYGTVLGAALGTAAWFAKPAVAVGLLVALTVVAAYVSVVVYQRATSAHWTPRRAFSATPILGALVVGVMSVAGAMYLGSSHANSAIGNIGSIISTSGGGSSHGGSGHGGGSNSAIGNIGSIVSVKGCSNMGSTAFGNIGSIIKIDGNGTCDVNDIMKGFSGIGNIGSIIIVDNACGDLQQAKAHFNIGAIIKVSSNGPCKPDEPTTVVVQPDPTPSPTPVTPAPTPEPAPIENAPAPVEVVKPAALPDTGPGGIALIALIAITTGYLFSMIYRLQTSRAKTVTRK